MTSRRFLVTADDFGLCPEMNQAICELYDKGIVQQASFLVNTPTFRESVQDLKSRPGLKIALHLNLTDGSPTASAKSVSSLLHKGHFLGGRHYSVLMHILTHRFTLSDIQAEWHAQIKKIVDLGLTPVCLNGHGHLHLVPRLQPLVLDLMHEFHIPSVRLSMSANSAKGRIFQMLSRAFVKRAAQRGMQIHYPDNIIGLERQGSLTADYLLDTLRRAPDGLSEVIVHPAKQQNEYHTKWGYASQVEFSAIQTRAVVASLKESR